MDQALVALVGAAVGGATSLAAVVITGRLANRLESQREIATRQRVAAERLRAQVAEVIRLMFRAEYAIYSICWYAKNIPSQVGQQRIVQYEENMERLMAEISGAMVVLSSLDSEAFRILNEYNDQISIFDGRVRLLMHRDHSPETIAKLSEIVEPLRELYLTMPKTVGPFLQELDQAQRSRGTA